MSLRQFNYLTPSTVDEAVATLRATPGALPLAGGQSLLYAMRSGTVTPPYLVDLRHVAGLRDVSHRDGAVVVGAMVPLSVLLSEDRVTRQRPAIAEALRLFGDPQIRNRGTVGGALVTGERGADLPIVALALGSVLSITDDHGSRQLPASEFFDELAPVAGGGLVTAVEFPAVGPMTSSAFEKRRDRASLLAISAAAVSVTLGDDGQLTDCRIAITGSMPAPRRLPEFEAALSGVEPTATAVRAALPALPASMFVAHPTTGTDYLAHLTRVLVARAVLRAASTVPVTSG